LTYVETEGKCLVPGILSDRHIPRGSGISQCCTRQQATCFLIGWALYGIGVAFTGIHYSECSK